MQDWWKECSECNRHWWKECCCNGSGIDENNVLNGTGIDEKNVAELEAVLMKRMLLKWKRDLWKECCCNGSGPYRPIMEWKWDWWKECSEWDRSWWKGCCWIGSGIDEKNVAELEAGLMKGMLLNWKRDWWKECCWMEAGLMKIMLLNWKRELLKRFPEMEANCPPLQISNNIDIIFCDELSATNCPRRIVLRRIVRKPNTIHYKSTIQLLIHLFLFRFTTSAVCPLAEHCTNHIIRKRTMFNHQPPYHSLPE